MPGLEELGSQVRATASQLPDAQLETAERSVRGARSALDAALLDSVEPAGRPALDRAAAGLGRARRQLGRARRELGNYLASIGLDAATPQKSDTVDASESAAAAPGGTDWWRGRVNRLTAGESATKPREVTVTKLFPELTDLAARGDRDRYRERLLEAGPAAGQRLAGQTWPAIRALGLDVLGRPPTGKDDEWLRRLTREPVAELLPKLPPDVVLEQWHGACSLPHDPKPEGDEEEREAARRHRAVDAAAVGPVLAAALLAERKRVRKDA